MAKVFISYAWEDTSSAERIEARLVEAGHEVWRDRNSLWPGEAVLNRILEALEECDALTILLSQNSKNSRWVFFEIENFLMSKLALSQDKIIPLEVESVDPGKDFPPLKTYQSINLTQDWDIGLRKLLSVLDDSSKVSETDLEDKQRLDFAVDLALRAGNVVMKYYNSSFRANRTLDSRKNAATKADKQTQLEIISAIKIHPYYRNDGIIAEEDSYKKEKPLKEGVTWVIDPLDGTQNFSNSIPLFCTAIGALKDGKPYIGVVYDLLNNELYYAVQGKPTRVWNISRGSDVIVNSNRDFSSLKECLLGTHISATPEKAEPLFSENILLSIQKSVKSIRTLGCGQLALAYIAAGRLQIFFQLGTHIWDQVAGIVLIENAGGVVRSLKGKKWKPATNEFFAASNAVLAKEFMKLWKPIGKPK